MEDDLKTAASRLDAASQQKSTLQEEVAKLVKELEEKKKAWQVAEKEEAWLKEPKTLHLKHRLENGWSDEDELIEKQ